MDTRVKIDYAVQAGPTVRVITTRGLNWSIGGAELVGFTSEKVTVKIKGQTYMYEANGDRRRVHG